MIDLAAFSMRPSIQILAWYKSSSYKIQKAIH